MEILLAPLFPSLASLPFHIFVNITMHEICFVIPIKFKHLYKLGRLYLAERRGTIYYTSQPDLKHIPLSIPVGSDVVYWTGGFEFNPNKRQVFLRRFVRTAQIDGPDLFGQASSIPGRALFIFFVLQCGCFFSY